MSKEEQQKATENNHKPPFEYLIMIKPLGFLYGSAGRFLSPENLVGRSGNSFPPSSATLSGIFAYQFREDQKKLKNLQLGGPFFADNDNPNNFYVPTPFNCLVKEEKIQYILFWQQRKWQTNINGEWQNPPHDKFTENTWIAIADWEKLLSEDDNELPSVKTTPWKFIPHLHPKLKLDERCVLQEEEGSLFLENGVQLDPDYCLVYLSNTKIENGWYRFGGEGHIVELECKKMANSVRKLLNQPLGCTFATITPAIWGSNRFSFRAPQVQPPADDQDRENIPNHLQQLCWHGRRVEALLTGRAKPFRYRLGNRKLSENEQQQDQVKRLSRGRYAMPAGTVYVLDKPLNKKWEDWDEAWFPTEGYSFKRWGCGLSLSMEREVSH
jgi:CRISPR-associated protein Cmr3